MNRLLEQVLQANIYIQPLQLFLGITTNILNIRVLSSRTLRSSPCTHYFLAYAIFCIIYTSLVCPTQFVRGLHIDPANGRVGCKMHSYALFVFPFLVNLMLILASFDRYCSSSPSRRFHSKCTIQTARINIIVATLSGVIYMSPMLVIYSWDESHNKCLPKTNIVIYIYTFSQVFLYYILTPVLMFIFGLLTITNIRQQSTRALPLTGSIRGRRTEGQLTRMLVLQVVVHLILVLPFGIIYCMNSFDPSTQTPGVIAVRLAFVTWQQCDYFVSFFLYVFSGSVYRQQLIRILRSIRGRTTPVQSFTENRRDTYREMPLIITSIHAPNGAIDDVTVLL
jgi:hypothetical protein